MIDYHLPHRGVGPKSVVPPRPLCPRASWASYPQRATIPPLRLPRSRAGGAAPPTWLGYLIAAIELLGGIAILLGIKTRWVAWALVVYVIIATGLAHEFWTMEGAARGANQANFYKNLAIIGGYLMLAIHGGGGYSVDGRPKTV